MKFSSLLLGSMALALSAATASATTYAGNMGGDNGGSNFGDPIGQGMLTLSTDGTNLNGSIKIGGSSGFNDELVIYIDDTAVGATNNGFTSTTTLTDTGNNADTLRGAISGLSNGKGANNTTVPVVRAPLNFPTGFAANAAIALSPAKADFGSFYTLTSAANFTYGTDGTNGNANLTPTNMNGTTGTGIFTFSVPLTLLPAGTKSFTFVTTYLDGNGAYRSNEALGNGIVDNSNTGNPTETTGAGTGSAMYNLGQDTGTLTGINTFVIPEPGTWVMLVGGAGLLAGFQRRRSRI